MLQIGLGILYWKMGRAMFAEISVASPSREARHEETLQTFGTFTACLVAKLLWTKTKNPVTLRSASLLNFN